MLAGSRPVRIHSETLILEEVAKMNHCALRTKFHAELKHIAWKLSFPFPCCTRCLVFHPVPSCPLLQREHKKVKDQSEFLPLETEGVQSCSLPTFAFAVRINEHRQSLDFLLSCCSHIPYYLIEGSSWILPWWPLNLRSLWLLSQVHFSLSMHLYFYRLVVLLS